MRYETRSKGGAGSASKQCLVEYFFLVNEEERERLILSLS